MHEEHLDALELKKRYQELQNAHLMQSKMLNGGGGGGGKQAPYLVTIHTQQQVIANLEKVLAQMAGDAKAAKELQKENKKLRAEMTKMRQDPSSIMGQGGQALNSAEVAELKEQLEATETRAVRDHLNT